MEYQYELKVPKERIAILIGKKGDVKKKVEDSTQTILDIDSKEGDVFIKGEDALNLFTAREVVRAISRGFNPEIALQLLNPDYCLEIISINDYSGKSKNTALRLKGRVIGEEGKSRTRIEELTETDLCVYGKTVAIIGGVQQVALARKAVDSLLTGAPHSNVYRWLESKRKYLKSGFLEDMGGRPE